MEYPVASRETIRLVQQGLELRPNSQEREHLNQLHIPVRIPCLTREMHAKVRVELNIGQVKGHLTFGYALVGTLVPPAAHGELCVVLYASEHLED